MADIDIFTAYKEEGPDWREKRGIKKYRFDYMEDAVKEWKSEHITRQMLELIPYDILIFADLTDSGYQKDHYGEDITDLQDWTRQREEFIDYLYNKYKR